MQRALTTSLLIVITLLLFSSCSGVRVVPEGESVLKENKIVALNNDSLNLSKLNHFVRQQPNSSFLFGLNPFVLLYNLSNGKGGAWDRFVHKVGQKPVILDTLLVNRTLLNLENHLNSIGYYNSKVRDSIVTKKKRSKVYYFIESGNDYIIRDLYYSIKDKEIEKIVLNNLNNSLIKIGDRLSQERLDKESERVTTLLRERGYYNFSKNYFQFEADTTIAKGEVKLLVKIENHVRSESSKEARAHQLYKIRDISIYSDYNPLESAERNQEEYRKIREGDVDIYHLGSRTIKPSTLAKMNRLRSGELYNERKANSVYDRFISLRYYSGVNIEFNEVEEDSTLNHREVDCIIRLTPSKSQGYKLNLEASSNSNRLLGLSPALSYYHKNLFRGGEWFSIGLMGNFQFKLNDPIRSSEFGLSSGLSIPSFLLLPDSLFKTNVPRTDINIGYNYQNRPEFIRNLISLNYGYSWRVRERFYYTVNPVQLNIIRLSNLDPSFYESLQDPFLKSSYRNHFDFGSAATLYYTTDSSPLPKSSYFYIRWSNDIAGNLLSLFNRELSADSTGAKLIWNTPYAQYFKSDFTVAYTHKPYGKNGLATRFNIGVGWAYGNSKALPFEKLFYAGGANSLRGWQARSVGPGSAAIDTTFSIPNQTGDIKLELNAEYRFDLFWNFEGALFVDAGNIWKLRSEAGMDKALFRFKDFYKSVAINWGTGIRLNLDFLVLRLDLGVIIRDPFLQSWSEPSQWFKRGGYAIQFGVGYPF